MVSIIPFHIRATLHSLQKHVSVQYVFFAKFLFVSRYDKINGIITNFINQTGLSMVETDGPYGGETCASTTHDHHASNDDSIYWQTRLQVRHPPMCRIRV